LGAPLAPAWDDSNRHRERRVQDLLAHAELPVDEPVWRRRGEIAQANDSVVDTTVHWSPQPDSIDRDQASRRSNTAKTGQGST
jgi:hypothetical protein